MRFIIIIISLFAHNTITEFEFKQFKKTYKQRHMQAPMLFSHTHKHSQEGLGL